MSWFMSREEFDRGRTGTEEVLPLLDLRGAVCSHVSLHPPDGSPRLFNLSRSSIPPPPALPVTLQILKGSRSGRVQQIDS